MAQASNLVFATQLPIIQAPMAGGATTPSLVAAVSANGGMGSLAAALLSPQDMIAAAAAIRALTEKPFQINLFVQTVPQPDPITIENTRGFLAPIYQSLGVSQVPMPSKWCEDFNAQFDALLQIKPALASFTFDLLRAEEIKQLKRAQIKVIGTATHLEEARIWQALGADGICLQGVEAGGHRGTFIGAQQDATQTLAQLIVECRPHLHVPIIAAGGIMHGRAMKHYLNLGAHYVQLGTAFLTTKESGISNTYKQALLSCNEDKTRQTKGISGRLARGIDNQLMRAVDAYCEQVPSYPQMNALTTALRAEANRQQNSEWLSLWAGQGVAGCAERGEITVKELIECLIDEWQQSDSY